MTPGGDPDVHGTRHHTPCPPPPSRRKRLAGGRAPAPCWPGHVRVVVVGGKCVGGCRRHVTARGSRHGDGAGHQDQAGQQGLPLRGECGRAGGRARGRRLGPLGRDATPSRPNGSNRRPCPSLPVCGSSRLLRRCCGSPAGLEAGLWDEGRLLVVLLPLASGAVARECRCAVCGEGGGASGGKEGAWLPQTRQFGLHVEDSVASVVCTCVLQRD